MSDTPSYFSILTASVRYSKDLTDFEKILFSEITALTHKNGYCTASNAWIAELYGKHPDTISKAISKLVKSGFLSLEIVRNEKNEIVLRKIFINANADTPIGKNADTPIGKNADTPIGKNADTCRQKRQREYYKNNQYKVDDAPAPARAVESIQVDDVNQVDDVTDNPSSDGLMFADWQPEDLQTFRQQLRRAMLPNWESEQVQVSLVEFVSYWQTRSETNSNSGWTHKFLQNLMRLKAQGAMVAKKTSDPAHRRFADKTTTPAVTPPKTRGLRPLGEMQ